MKKQRLILLLSVLSSLALMTLHRAQAREDRVQVVATIATLGSLAHAVGRDRIELTVIAHPGQDAHTVDPKPSFMVKMRRADLLLVNGLDLEIGWIPPLTEGSRNNKILPGGPGYIDCSEGLPVLEVPTSLSREQGDVHPYGNPHYLADPLYAELVAGRIASALAKADPDGAAAYESGRRAFVERLHAALFGNELVGLVGGAKLSREAFANRLDAFLDGTLVGGTPLRSRLGGWLGRMQPVRDKPVITYYRDASYFAGRFRLQVVANVQPKPGILPSAKHLEDLVHRLERGEAGVVITRSFAETRSTELLAKRTGAVILELPLDTAGASEEDFFALHDRVTTTLAEALARTSGAR